MLCRAYGYRQQKRMRDAMERIVEVCRGTKDRHFGWFARLVESHMDGIVAHARHHISSGKVEGTNQMIKTLRGGQARDTLTTSTSSSRASIASRRYLKTSGAAA